jgi:hypothetical protein
MRPLLAHEVRPCFLRRGCFGGGLSTTGILPLISPTPCRRIRLRLLIRDQLTQPVIAFDAGFFLVSDIGRKVRQMPRPLLCPICKSPAAQELDRTYDARGFYWTIHGHFKVADSIAVDDYYTRAEWEVALRAAKYKAMEGEWPVIRPGDFFR